MHLDGVLFRRLPECIPSHWMQNAEALYVAAMLNAGYDNGNMMDSNIKHYYCDVVSFIDLETSLEQNLEDSNYYDNDDYDDIENVDFQNEADDNVIIKNFSFKLLEVILNGDSPPPTRTVEGVETPYPPTTVEEKLAKKNELKARGTLLMALSNEYQLKFNCYKTAKSPIEAIEKRFRDFETLSMDDLYNNLKIYEAEVMGSSSTTQNIQNVAFMSSNNIDSTNKAVNTAHGVSAASFKTNASNLPNVDSLSDAVIYSFFASQSNSPLLDNEDLNQIDPNDLEEMDLKGHFAKKCKASKHQDNKNREAPRRIVPVKDTTSNDLVSRCDGLGYDWSDQAKDGPTNFTLMAYTSSSSLSSSNSDTEVSTCSKACLKSYETLKEHYDNLIKDFNMSQFNLGEGYHAVPPPYTGNFMPLKPDLVFADEHVVSESVTSLPNIAKNEVTTSETKLKNVSAPIIKDWVSDSEDEDEIETKTKQIKPSFAKVKFVKSTKHVKFLRKSVKQEESNMQTKYPWKTSQSPRVVTAVQGNGKNVVNVLLTETECLVISPDFKLLDENQVLLKVPRQNNVYSFDLKNVALSGGLTCLFAKATIDESNLWHRRLGYINFKTMNKLVRGNLVRAQHSVNDFVVINIPEEDVEPKQIILDPDDQPMWESAKTVAPTPNSAIIQLDVDDNFVINSTHLNMIQENKFDGYLRANPHDHIREFLAICDIFRYGETQKHHQISVAFIDGSNSDVDNSQLLEKLEALTIKMDSQFQSLNKKMHEMRKNYNNCGGDHASMNDETPTYERHKENFIRSEGYLNRNSHDSYFHQSHHDLVDFEKPLTELNNNVRNDLEDFKRCVRSMRTIHLNFLPETM
nr:ribonuclease H-like domain-containing protein [Tanacetum cinerariifolium]